MKAVIHFKAHGDVAVRSDGERYVLLDARAGRPSTPMREAFTGPAFVLMGATVILIDMADHLYLSLWYANFRFAELPAALDRVMRQFAAVSGSEKVRAATVYPLSWQESPVYQRVYGEKDTDEQSGPEHAIGAATEMLHEDYAYEFEMAWDLWVTEAGGGLDAVWKKEPRIVRITGFGPAFDEGTFEQNGQIRLELGSDSPFLQEGVDLDAKGAGYVKENVQKLVDLTTALQKNAGVATRLLWSESGEDLAQKLISRLQSLN